MFESLDENSPARVPAPGDRMAQANRVGRAFLTICAVVSGVLARRGAGEDSIRNWLAWIFIAIACLGFVVFEVRAYRDRKSGPIDLRLDR